MKKILISISLVILLCLSITACTNNTIMPNDSINQKISEQSGNNFISLDDCGFSWDFVIIDSAYSAEETLKELDISNRNKISKPPYDDVIVLYFIKENIIVEYTTAQTTDDTSKILANYIYQNTKESYQYGTVFEIKE